MRDILMAYSEWLNKTMMTAFRAFSLTFITVFALVVFTLLGAYLLLDRTATSEAVMQQSVPRNLSEPEARRIADLRAAARTIENTRQDHGKEIITLIFTFLTAAIVTNAASQFGDRVTAKEHVEAKERGKITGAAIAASMTPTNGNGNGEKPVTGEQEAIKQRMSVSTETIKEG